MIFGDFGVFGHDGEVDSVTQKLADGVKNHMILGRRDIDMVVTTGDNFYDSGVSSSTDPKVSKLLSDTFLIDHFGIPWYPVLGT